MTFEEDFKKEFQSLCKHKNIFFFNAKEIYANCLDKQKDKDAWIKLKKELYGNSNSLNRICDKFEKELGLDK